MAILCWITIISIGWSAPWFLAIQFNSIQFYLGIRSDINSTYHTYRLNHIGYINTLIDLHKMYILLKDIM